MFTARRDYYERLGILLSVLTENEIAELQAELIRLTTEIRIRMEGPPNDIPKYHLRRLQQRSTFLLKQLAQRITTGEWVETATFVVEFFAWKMPVSTHHVGELLLVLQKQLLEIVGEENLRVVVCRWMNAGLDNILVALFSMRSAEALKFVSLFLHRLGPEVASAFPAQLSILTSLFSFLKVADDRALHAIVLFQKIISGGICASILLQLLEAGLTDMLLQLMQLDNFMILRESICALHQVGTALSAVGLPIFQLFLSLLHTRNFNQLAVRLPDLLRPNTRIADLRSWLADWSQANRNTNE